MRLMDLAEAVRIEHDCVETLDTVLSGVTTLAADLGYRVPAGGWSPDTVVTVEDARHIRAAYRL